MMKFNTTMGTAIVPLLARLVLCAAFLTMGWNKLYYDHEFRGDDVQILIELGVVEKPASGGAVARPASFMQFGNLMRGENADEEADDETTQDMRERAREAVDETRETVEEAIDAIVPARPGIVTRDPQTGELIAIAKRMHTVSLIVHKHDGPNPVIMAWIATLVELIGGALLLIGLFARLWGILLAGTMAVAFYLTSWPALAELGLFGVAADMTGGYANFNRMYVQLALFVLAFGVFLTGAGSLSLDRWLFRPSTPRKDLDADD